MFAYSGAINSVWYLEYQIVGSQIIIERHFRLHGTLDTNHPDTTEEFYLCEDDNRIVHAAIIDGVEYQVANPRHVFSY